jgi:ATPase subunit of ABC transporter with duplicated ATPase domains
MSTVTLNTISFELYKTCFEGFSAQVHAGDRIGIIGNNGAGKTTLLRVLMGDLLPTGGELEFPEGLVVAYVPQLITDYPYLSGAQRFQKCFSEAVAQQPDVLVLDEPTNHLDRENRTSLIRFLKHFKGILFMATHDTELLKAVATNIWHLEEGVVHVFHGGYGDYEQERLIKHQQHLGKLEALQREKRQAHQSLIAEHQRQHQSRKANQDENDRSLKGAMRESGSRTAGRLEAKARDKKHAIETALTDLWTPEILRPKFDLPAHLIHADRSIVHIQDGCIKYQGQSHWIMQNICLQIPGGQRIAIMGPNGCGKSTLLKAIYGNPTVERAGDWMVPNPDGIAYLDQHYATLKPGHTVFQTIQEAAPHLEDRDIRRVLNDFLFRKNEEVFKETQYLSGGEKARLCLAQISVHRPQLLLLDEVTNNIDQLTRHHLVQILQSYPGTLVVVSHDSEFLNALNLDEVMSLETC